MQSIDARSENWEWSRHVSIGPPGFRIHGSADSKPAALAEIERQWSDWMVATGLVEK